MNRYKKTGWFNESVRHGLARRGIRTGTKSLGKINFAEMYPRYDSRKSFYGKADVRQEGNRLILKSYNTDVAFIENGKAYVNGMYSDTTARHIKEFLKQNDFEAESSKQIMKDYGVREGHTPSESQESGDAFKSVAMVAELGEIFGTTQKEKNDWKLRMIKAGFEGKGLIMPEDWDTLSEDEKEKRLNKIIEEFSRTKKKTIDNAKTQFGQLTPEGKVTKSMSIDINKVKSDDPLAYSYGYFQAKSGQPMSKDKDLAKEYIRGYKDAKAGKPIDQAKKSKISPRTTIMSKKEFSKWTKNKGVYDLSDSGGILYESTAFNKDGSPITFMYKTIFIPKNVKFKKSYYDKFRTPAGWKKGAQVFEDETVSGKQFHQLKDVWNASYNEKNKMYYITKRKR